MHSEKKKISSVTWTGTKDHSGFERFLDTKDSVSQDITLPDTNRQISL
jgi:hypothetical protein